MLNLEDAFHAIFRAFSDGEGLGLQSLEGAWRRKIERDIRSTFYFLAEGSVMGYSFDRESTYQGQGLNDAFAGIVWIRNGVA